MTIQTRNESDTTWSDTSVFTTFSTVGLQTKDATGLKEIVRLKIEFDAGDAATDGLRFLIPAPSWRPE